jgi:hypothetical protein
MTEYRYPDQDPKQISFEDVPNILKGSANSSIYTVRSGEYLTFTTPKASNWQCQVFGGPMGIVWTPREGQEPNWFHRKMQELCFGVKWKKVK